MNSKEIKTEIFFCYKYWNNKINFRKTVIVHQFLKLILFIVGISCVFSPVFSQPSGNLEAKYYNTDNRSSTFNNFAGTVIETRYWDKIDTTNYNPQGQGDRWSVDVQGYIFIPSLGNYYFETYSDDGVRLKVDGQIVINNWTDHAPTINTGSINLQAGWKQIHLQMYEWGGGTRLRLRWKPPGQSNYSFPPTLNLSSDLPDTTAPTLSVVSISSDNSTSTKAVPDDVVSLTFTASETISTPTVTFSSGGASVNGTVSVQNTNANTWTASFAANANDTAGPVTYSIAFSDSAGNAGTAVTSTSDGTAVAIVIDSGAPTLLSSTPSDNSAGATLDQNIVLTFSEDVIAGSGDIELFERSGNTLVESFTVSSSMISGATVTLNPAADFKPNASYYLQIPATAFVDAAGNNYAGITNKTAFDFTTRQRTAKEAFTEVKDDIGAKMKSNTTKQIRSFATATTAVVSSARGRVFSKRVSSSRSGGATRSVGGGGGSSGGSGGGAAAGGATGGGGSDGSGEASGGGTDGGSNDSSNDSDTESSFDLRSSTRGTNASGIINGVLQSADGKLTRYTETQFSYTKSENETETGSASSQVIFERERSEELTLGHFLGFSLSKNSTVDSNTTDIESVGLQVGGYFVRNMTEDLFVDGYVAVSLLANKMEVTTTSMTAEADYVSRMGAMGLAVTGSFDIDRWEVLPTFAADYSAVSSQEAAFEVTSGAGNSNELSSPGNVRQLSLTFSPDFRTSFDYYDGYWSQGSTFSVKPKVTCQRVDQGTITEECGQGANVSVTSQDESQMKTLSFTLGIDTISNDTTYSANALYKVEF